MNKSIVIVTLAIYSGFAGGRYPHKNARQTATPTPTWDRPPTGGVSPSNSENTKGVNTISPRMVTAFQPTLRVRCKHLGCKHQGVGVNTTVGKFPKK